MSQKISLKNILIGVAIGLGIMFLILLIFYYIYVFPLRQDMKRMQKQTEKFNQIFLEWQKAQQTQ